MPAAAPPIIEPPPRARPEEGRLDSAVRHLIAHLSRLRLLLHREVLRLRAAGLFSQDQFRGLYVSDDLVDAVLRRHYDRLAASNGSAETQPLLSDLTQQIIEAQDAIHREEQDALAAGLALPLVSLATAFSLSKFERDALLLCAAPDLDPQFELLFSYAQNDVTRKRPTPDLILRLLCDTLPARLEQRSAFSAAGTLFAGALVRFAESTQERDPTLLCRPTKADERVIEFLLNQSRLDARLRPFTRRIEDRLRLAELEIPARLAVELGSAAAIGAKSGAVLFLHGPEDIGKRCAAAALSFTMGRPLLVVDAVQACGSEWSAPSLLTLLRREALLEHANIFIAHAEALLGDEAPGKPKTNALGDFVPPGGSLLFVSSESPWPGAGRSVRAESFMFEFPMPGYTGRLHLWESALGEADCAQSPGVDPSSLAGKFVLTGGEIQAACREAERSAAIRGAGSIAQADLEAAARAQSNQGLRRLAQKVNAAEHWNDLVLLPRALRQLREVCATEMHRHKVYSQWGFGDRLSSGLGLNVLFHGPSGTGKTMAAGVIAAELGLDLYKIDLSTVVSKYIGETEKQLSQIFREARSSNAILFFDEADAMFGRRSEVKDAHDRYANIEVAYLLQKMEEYEGIVILATNFRKNMDEAFTRRMQHIVEFPLPDAEQRERIWRRLMPSEAPSAPDVNFGFLARQFQFAGGNIRNVVLAAAFLAAADGCAIAMKHFILATARELHKLGKLPGRAEFREYFELIQARD